MGPVYARHAIQKFWLDATIEQKQIATELISRTGRLKP
jgi:hypothetical protein